MRTALILCLIAGAIGWGVWSLRDRGANAEEVANKAAQPVLNESEALEEADSTTLQLPESTWKGAGLEIKTVGESPLGGIVQVTGAISLNEDRVAHVYPLVEGRVDQVFVQFGDQVKAGDVLAIIQSKEVGERKLELVQSRLNREIAAVKRDRAEEISRNARDLIAALESNATAEEIEQSFRGRPIGEFRETLVTAYTSLGKVSADYDRIADLTDKGVTAAKELNSAKAARNAARATLTALLESAKFDAIQQAVTANQALREAETRVAAGEAALAILGYSPEELQEIDPVKEGEAISHYPVVAPFDGTILSKDIVLLESVGPDRQLFQIADLSKVWIVADVYEQHIPVLDGLHGKTVNVHSAILPGLAFEASVFFRGETVEESSRTVRLRAVADNPDRRLKPGMFVQVDLPMADDRVAVQVPEAAVVAHAGQTFVFLHRGGDKFEQRDVTIGHRGPAGVEIVEGVQVGDRIVSAGAFALKSQVLADLMAED